MRETLEDQKHTRQNRELILWNLSFGHAIAHWFGESLPVILPYIQATMGFSNVQYGLIGTVQGISSGVINVPGGFLVDRLKRHWGPILALCTVWTGVSYVMLGAAPNYLFMLAVGIFVILPGTIWHLPATAALSQRFPDRRGFALSIHGVGANAGNFIGPIVTGALLGVLFWRNVAFIYVVPTMAAAVFFWVSLRNLGKEGVKEEKKALGTWFREAARMVRNPMVIGLVTVSLLRTGSLSAVLFWLPRYLGDPVEDGGLGMTSVMVGLHFAFLAGMGVVSGPVLGLISDRVGRKAVLVPGLVLSTILPVIMVNAGGGLLMTLVIVLMGLFAFSLHQILIAAVLDVVGRGTEATAVGLLFGGANMVSGVSPVIAAFVINSFGLGAIFYYIAIVTGVSTVVMIRTPMKTERPTPLSGS